MKKQRLGEAREVLRTMGEADFEQELHEIIDSIDLEHSANDVFFSWKYRLPIFLAVTIGMSNQLSGINAILYYLNDIFGRAGFSKVARPSIARQSLLCGGTILPCISIRMG